MAYSALLVAVPGLVATFLFRKEFSQGLERVIEAELDAGATSMGNALAASLAATGSHVLALGAREELFTALRHPLFAEPLQREFDAFRTRNKYFFEAMLLTEEGDVLVRSPSGAGDAQPTTSDLPRIKLVERRADGNFEDFLKLAKPSVPRPTHVLWWTLPVATEDASGRAQLKGQLIVGIDLAALAKNALTPLLRPRMHVSLALPGVEVEGDGDDIIDLGAVRPPEESLVRTRRVALHEGVAATLTLSDSRKERFVPVAEATVAFLLQVLVFVLLGLALSWIVARRFIVTPVRDLTRMALAYMHGAEAHPPQRSHFHEFDTMASSIATMVMALQQSSRALDEKRREAEEASSVKSEFLANTSHEIRTPLTAILGFTELVLEGVCSEEENRELLERVQKNGEHLLRIIDDILDLSKVEADKLELEPASFVLRECVEEVASLFKPLAEGRGLAMETWIDPLVPRVAVADRTRLKQILVNLVGNAIKFTPSGKVFLRVVSAPAGADAIPRVCFSVEDTGVGLTSKQQEQLFRPFSQADNSVSRRFGGTGLGLALSRRLAHLMGGQLNLAWSIEHRGSEFVLVIPMIQA